MKKGCRLFERLQYFSVSGGCKLFFAVSVFLLLGLPFATLAASPDLVITTGSPTLTPPTVAPGGTVTISAWTVKNQGGAPTASGGFWNGFYLSTDPVITSSDTFLMGVFNNDLAAGAQTDWPADVLTIPVSTAPGTYYIGILADWENLVAESDESNNYVSRAITVAVSVVNGSCGSADTQTFLSAPAIYLLCSGGSPTALSGSGPWTWSCMGSNGGTNSPLCSANIKTWTVTPSAGAGGIINPNTAQTVNNGFAVPFTVTPNSGFTATVGGTCGGGPASGTALFTYTTNPIIANCSVAVTFSAIPLLVDGICGSANGQAFMSAPATNLCSAGTPTGVTGSGPWTWSCTGSNGGATAFCSASSAGPRLTVSSTNPNSGLSFVYRLHGQIGWQGGATPLSTIFTVGDQLEIALPFVAFSTGSNIFSGVNGCDAVSFWSNDPALSNTIICSVTMNADKTITVQYSTIASGPVPITPSIFWENGLTGQLVLWFMDGITNTGQTVITTLPPGWRVVGVGDINGDGEPDIVLFNDTTGDIYIDYVDGGVLAGSQAGGKVIGAEWMIVGIADFDGDGHPDYLWHNQVTGRLYVWYMGFDEWHGIFSDGGAELSFGGGIMTPDPAIWEIVGARDFNGDGKIDILGQNKSTGDLFMWFTNGTTVTGGVPITGNADLNWMVVGVGDFNKDGKPDILWRNQSTGQDEVWFMNGAAKTGSAGLTSVDTSWEIVGPK